MHDESVLEASHILLGLKASQGLEVTAQVVVLYSNSFCFSMLYRLEVCSMVFFSILSDVVQSNHIPL